MLVVETVVRIRREYAAGKPIKAICRDLRLSRKVVRKAIRAEEGAFSYQRMTQPFPKIGPVRDRLDQLLTENEARPRRDRLRLTRVWDLLVQEGYDGSYDSVRRYAARWREEIKAAPGDGGTAFVPLLFAPGEAFQFDFSHEDVEVAGQPMRVGIFGSGWLIDRFTRVSKRAYGLAPAIALVLAVPCYLGFVAAPHWPIALACLLPAMCLNHVYLSSAVTLVQNEVRPNQRVMSGALLLLVMNFIGLGLGPTYVGAASDFFRAAHPDNSLQVALFTLVPFYAVAIGLFLLLARALDKVPKTGAAQ